jgi:TBC1 domain family protein 5
MFACSRFMPAKLYSFPDIAYFRDPDVQAHLTNVLYLWSAMNTQIGYRQGMHEILAMLYIALDYDSLEEHTVDGVLAQLCSRGWVAADAWSLFDSVMHAIGRWCVVLSSFGYNHSVPVSRYEWREPSQPMASASPSKTHASLSLDKGQVAQTSYVSPIIQACNEVQFKFLKATDPELWRSLQAAGIEPQIYGMYVLASHEPAHHTNGYISRWLRLLFTRELSMPESMMIWDGLFACDPHIHLAKWICVAMLIRIRNQRESHLLYSVQWLTPPQSFPLTTANS